MSIKSLLCIFVLLSFANCNPQYPKDVRYVLEVAGTNKNELIKVLEHYKNSDSLKYNAACFLISNMHSHYTNYMPKIQRQKEFINIIDSLNNEINNHHKIDMSKVRNLWDSLMNLPISSPSNPVLKPDIHEIKAEYLINNIDLAFLAWKKPWAKNLTFENFCEYILPYRCTQEPIDNWRNELLEKYSWIEDSVRGSISVINACTLVNDDLKEWFIHHPLSYISDLSYSELARVKRGRCPDMANLATYSMRANGIPVSIDFTPQWPDRSMGHNWNTLLIGNNKNIEFMGTESNPGTDAISTRKMAKIYRRTFAIQKNSLPFVKAKHEKIPPFFYNTNYIDVTKTYIPCSDLYIENINKNFKLKKGTHGYLCVFNNKDWIPIDWGPINKNHISFNQIGLDIVYLVMGFKNDRLQPINHPFILTKEKKIKYLNPDTTKLNTVILKRKYPMSKNMILYANQMIGGMFQTAMNREFYNAQTIHTIDIIPENFEERSVSGTAKFVRYRIQDTTWNDIGEIEFYGVYNGESDTVKLEGEVICQLWYKNKERNNFLKAFDNDPNTFYKGKRGEWIGLKLKKTAKITKIRYIPRNDTNYIIHGNIYELFYYNFGWHSLGRKKAKADHLKYQNVPGNALLLLHNHTGGKEERIFTYNQNKQQWH